MQTALISSRSTDLQEKTDRLVATARVADKRVQRRLGWTTDAQTT